MTKTRQGRVKEQLLWGNAFLRRKSGGPTPNMEHNQSAELVEEVKKRAKVQHETQKDDQPHQKTQYEYGKSALALICKFKPSRRALCPVLY